MQMKSNLLVQYQKRTNQKIFYAHLLLELMRQQEEPYAAALRDSCLLHLVQGYESLVDEIQSRLNRPPQPERNLLAIVRNLKGSDGYAVEINRLVRLEQDNASWLNGMRRAHNRLLSGMSSAQLITDEPVDANGLSAWLAQLEALSLELRAAMIEY